MKPKKPSQKATTTKGARTYSTPKKQSPRRYDSGKGVFTPEKNRERLEEKQLIIRCKELGYEQDETRSFPCWCGKKDENCVWLLTKGKSKGPHFFCLACTERRPTSEYEEVVRDYKKAIRPMQIAVNNELTKLLKDI